VLSAVIGGSLGIATGLTLGLLENFWVDSLFKGKNPSMFIDHIRQEIAPEADLISDP
jgi:hypothetical protein